MQRKAAQVSVEFLIIFSVTLLALLIFMSLTQSESADVSMAKVKTDAHNAVHTLVAAAQDVYSQGAGAKKKVTVSIPPGYDPNASFVSGRAIKLRAAGSDYVELTEFEVYGSLPQSYGNKEIWIISEGGRVRIGGSIVKTDRETINLIIGVNDSRSDTFTLTSLVNSTVKVRIAPDWSQPVSLSLSESEFLLPAYGSNVITVKFGSALNSSIGFYTGSLNITADDGTRTHSIEIPVSLEIAKNIIPQGGPPLTVVPSRFNTTLEQGGSETRTFQVCTNSETTLDSVEFTTSSNWPGTWAGMLSPLSRLETRNCKPKTLSVTVPENAGAGNWTGYVYATGHGTPDTGPAEDVIVLDILVINSINRTDTEGPEVTDIFVFPSRREIFEWYPVTFRVSASDSGKGDNEIAGCQISIDNSSWHGMWPSDGRFDDLQEDATLAFLSGYSKGLHTARARCTDANNNTGAIYNKDFIVLTEFLFITENSTPATEENAWMDWIGSHVSYEGYPWNINHTDSASFMNGSVDLSYYAVLLAERWVDGMEQRINTHLGSGGSVVFLGHALEEAPYALNLSNEKNSPATGSNLNFYDGSHYITQGVYDRNKIADSDILLGRLSNFSGTILVSGPGVPAGFHMLGISDTMYFWGPADPSGLNELGINVTTRMLDHAVNASRGDEG